MTTDARTQLAAFDATCATLRVHYAEWVRRERLRARHWDAMDATWLKWLELKEGPEPPQPNDDDVARMLSSACDAAKRVFGRKAHEQLLFTADDCEKTSISTRLDALKWWQNRVLEALVPKLQAIVDVPMRAKFGDEHPECIRMIVSSDVKPQSMQECADLLDSISSGTLRYCANVVENVDELIAQCDAGEFDAAFKQSWNHCIATVRHENVTR